MALRDLLTYTKAWVSNQGLETLPAAVDNEADARANLQVQHTEARNKINEIVGAIVTTIGNDDTTIPTSKAVADAIAETGGINEVRVAGTALVPSAGSVNIEDISNCTAQNSDVGQPPVSVGAMLNTLNGVADAVSNLAPVATSGNYSYLENTPIADGELGDIAVYDGVASIAPGFKLTISSGSPSGGNDGDIWIKYEA